MYISLVILLLPFISSFPEYYLSITSPHFLAGSGKATCYGNLLYTCGLIASGHTNMTLEEAIAASLAMIPPWGLVWDV